MQEPQKQLNTFQSLLPDLLVLIVIQTGDPIHFGRLLQLSKAIRAKFNDPAKTKKLWQFFLQKEFPKFQTVQDNPDFQLLYRQQSDLKTIECELEPEYRRLYNLIKIGDLCSLQKGKNLPDMSTEEFFYMKNGMNPVLIAKHFNQQGVLNFFYDLIHKNVFSKQERDRHGRTALHYASACNILSSVKDLIKLKKNTDPVDKLNITPLGLAAVSGNIDVVKELLASGSKVNHASLEGRTALHYAAGYGHANIVAVLLAAGAIVDQADKNGETALYKAAKNRQADVLRLLIAARATVNVTTSNGESPLYVAAKEGNIEEVKILLDAGAPVDQVANNGATPLYIAAQQGHADVVQTLNDAGADINFRFPNGVTPLYIAALQGNYDVVKTLLAAKVNIVQTNHDPVYIAAQNNHLNVLMALTTAGASVDEGGQTGYTPLYIAVLKGHHAIVRALLKMDARIGTICINGKTAINIAQEPLLTLLKLWHAHQVQKEFTLFSEVVTILKMPLTDFFTRALNSLTSFFSSPAEDRHIEEIMHKLADIDHETKGGTLKAKYKQLLESKRSHIPAVKYEFIMEVSLAPDEPLQPEGKNTKGFK